MDSFLSLSTVAAAIGFFILFRKFRSHQDNKEIESFSSSSLSSAMSSSSLSRKYDVFPSFRGEDVRKDFLSHIYKEFQRKGITPFIDNNIKRGKSIGPELIQAIRGSKIAIVLLSKNYASSSWCLDELVQIMKCREEFGQTVIVVFYKVDPSHVKKLTGDFGKVFRNTCKYKRREDIKTWREAFAKVATVAGYDSNTWDTEAAMIEKIVSDISNLLYHSTPSNDFNSLIGLGAHMKKMEPYLRLDLGEVRMIGIWGPPGIGKTTIARFLFHQISNRFQLKVFMDSIKETYTIPASSDHYNTELHLQQQFLSQITSQKDIQIPHLGVAQDRLKDKKVLIMLDDVNHSVQLDAMAKNTQWFGPESRIIITTQDRGLLREHGIEYIYEVDYPIYKEAFEMFCMYAFGQKSPYDGFEELAREVTQLSGRLPLGLKVMGSHFRRKSKQQWTMALQRLRTRLDGNIESILKFSYDALSDVDKELFLHIACFFNKHRITFVEEQLKMKFPDVMQGLHVLADKSIISMGSESSFIDMHNLLVQLGREIVRKQSTEPGQRQFLVDIKDIRKVFTKNTGSESVLGISLYDKIDGELKISERAFEEMSNLQFLRLYGGVLHLPRGLNCLSGELRMLDWKYFQSTSLPSEFCTDFLVKLSMMYSKLEKLWDGIQPLINLKEMNLSFSQNLKELPDLSTATSLYILDLSECSSLEELPASIRNANNLYILDLSGCSSLKELPASIGNTSNLHMLNLRKCSSLVKLPSYIGNATNLERLYLDNCSSLMELPSSIGNVTNLQELTFYGCSRLVLELNSSIGNTTMNLTELSFYGCSSLVDLPSSIGNATNLEKLSLRGCSNLKEIPSSIGNLTNIRKLDLRDCSSLVKLPSSIGNLHKLWKLPMAGCSKLEALPANISLESLMELDLTDCSLLKSFPQISTRIMVLKLSGTAIEEITSSTMPCLGELDMSDCENLKEFPHAFSSITLLRLSGKETQETPPWMKRFSDLRQLTLNQCRKLVSLQHIPDSLEDLDAEDCESLETLYWSPDRSEFGLLNFTNCFKLNKEARDLIIQTPTCKYAILPGKEVPLYFFTYQAIGDSVTVKLNERLFPTYFIFKVCLLFAYKDDKDDYTVGVTTCIEDKHNGHTVKCTPSYLDLSSGFKGHMCIFEVNAKVEATSTELSFKFKTSYENSLVGECGVQLHGTYDPMYNY